MVCPGLYCIRRSFLHTDEYEIALFKEVDVCTGHIRRYQCLLDSMEARHGMTTTVFKDRDRQGDIPATRDFTVWRDGVEALQRWNARRDEYERLLGIMKISAS